MKILKYLVLLAAILLIGGYFWVSSQPDIYDVKRTQLIKAPATVIYNNINDFKNWKEWGPWYDEDPTIEETYPEQTSGVGGSYSWISKDGPGSMKTLAVEENKSITQSLQFSDYEPTVTSWTFEETEEGTIVTWSMKSDKIPFMFKVFGAISGGMDNMLGPMLENGLNKMDTAIQEEMIKNPPKQKISYSIGSVIKKELHTQYFIGYSIKSKISEMQKIFAEYMPKSAQYMVDNDLIGKSTPAGVYTIWDLENGNAEYYIGLLVQDDITPTDGMEKVSLPAGKTLQLSKFGPYGEGDYEAHTSIEKYMKDNGLEHNDLVWELYLNDPALVEPSAIQTDIYYAIK